MNARDVIEQLAAVCETLASQAPDNLEAVRHQIPLDTPEYDRGFIDGNCAGYIKAYSGLAEDLRKLLRDNPSATVHWPQVSIGLGILWPVGGSN